MCAAGVVLTAFRMHIDARTLDNGSLIEGDLCIIGAGAAGISIAREFFGTAVKVILLEGGGLDYDLRVQKLYDGKTTGQPYYPLMSSELHYFGGTTGHWAGMCSHFDPITFRKRDWIEHSGWPITHETLLPYYERAHPVLDLNSNEFDLKHWQQKDPSLVALPLNDDVVRTKLWQFSPPTRFGDKYRKEVIAATNVWLYTYANVVDITGNDDVSSIREVTVKNYAGRTHTVRARVFVVACAGIQNARVLLAANRQASRGIGNDHDLVGRFFMEHLEIKSAELWLKQRSELKLYMAAAPRVQGELAISARKQAELEVLYGIVSFTPLEYAQRMPPYIQVWTDADPRVSEEAVKKAFDSANSGRMNRIFRSLFEGHLPRMHQAFQMTMRLEQAPNPLSRVTLADEKDELGVPRAALHWAFTSLERKSVRRIYETLGQQAGAAGLGRVKLKDGLADDGETGLPASTSAGWHHMGTTRMSDDPKRGVVDANCRVHGIGNLYIAGSSCFPTASAVNPTFTIVAMAIRLADRLKQQLA
ncbi:MAG TPA: GMC family oxidoreductase [Candidatus Didemnitutus sp.]|nr:GMC family oxidoreductase [Candidatus Didemnitutus sp.]